MLVGRPLAVVWITRRASALAKHWVRNIGVWAYRARRCRDPVPAGRLQADLVPPLALWVQLVAGRGEGRGAVHDADGAARHEGARGEEAVVEGVALCACVREEREADEPRCEHVARGVPMEMLSWLSWASCMWVAGWVEGRMQIHADITWWAKSEPRLFLLITRFGFYYEAGSRRCRDMMKSKCDPNPVRQPRSQRWAHAKVSHLVPSHPHLSSIIISTHYSQWATRHPAGCASGSLSPPSSCYGVGGNANPADSRRRLLPRPPALLPRRRPRLDLGAVQVRPPRVPADSSMVPYIDVDWLYGWPALQKGDGFTNAQGNLRPMG